jgi:hypothetical protein
MMDLRQESQEMSEKDGVASKTNLGSLMDWCVKKY